MMGLLWPESSADLRMAILLVICSGTGLLSAAVTAGDPFQGYVYGQSVCPVLALLAALPDVKERERLRGISIVY